MHYLRARAQHHRWAEEFLLVGYEMQWTVRYFLRQAEIWQQRAVGAAEAGRPGPGPVSYALRKSAAWRTMAHSAEEIFMTVNSSYTRLAFH